MRRRGGTTGITVGSSKNGAYVDAAVMSGTSVSTKLMNVLPSVRRPRGLGSRRQARLRKHLGASRALSVPGASLLITMYFMVPPLTASPPPPDGAPMGHGCQLMRPGRKADPASPRRSRGVAVRAAVAATRTGGIRHVARTLGATERLRGLPSAGAVLGVRARRWRRVGPLRDQGRNVRPGASPSEAPWLERPAAARGGCSGPRRRRTERPGDSSGRGVG